ncbi:GTPase activating protein (GAP) for Rho1p [Coemansia sp. RSA 986]|nr:GTPase activating protein (GAP) for Rho1p [Coemansia sp. RSA 986]
MDSIRAPSSDSTAETEGAGSSSRYPQHSNAHGKPQSLRTSPRMMNNRSYTADMATRPASNGSSSQQLQHPGGVPRAHTHSYGSAPQTVTAKMVDPTVLADALADYGTSTPRSASSRSSVYGQHQYQYQQQRQQLQLQTQQPTIASLALADSRGELDREFEYNYYQQQQQQQQQYPHSIRTDYRPAQGFYSEPTSATGSPVSIAQADGRLFQRRGPHSSDNAMVRQSGSVPTSSALGVTFSANSSESTTTKTKTSSRGGGVSFGEGVQALPMSYGAGQEQTRSSNSVIAGDSNTSSSNRFGGNSSRYTASHTQTPGRMAAHSSHYADAASARSPRGGEIHLNNASNSSVSSFYSSNAHQQQQRRQAEPPSSSSFVSADCRPASTAEYSGSAGVTTSAGASGGGRTLLQSHQLSVLHEGNDGSTRGISGDNGRLNHTQHKAQNSTDHTPCISSPSTSAVSLTAASSSFSFRNSTHQANSSYHPVQNHSQNPPRRPQQQQQQHNAGGSTSRYSTAASTNRDSMFLRLKEKMRSFKQRSRPQSDNLSDKRMALSCTSSQGIGTSYQQQQDGTSASQSHGKPGNTNSSGSESPLFGVPLTIAVRLAGVRVGRVAGSGEPCVVPTVVAVCGLYLWQNGRKTQGIFRVNGSMKRVQRLQDEFNTPPSYGRHIEWVGYTLHDAATILRRYLISLPESVISVEHYSAFLEKLAEALPDDVKARDFGTMISALIPEARNTLLYILEMLSVFSRSENSARTLMNTSNLAAVLQPCLLVHPGHVADPQEYGKAKDVVEFLIANAPMIYPSPDAEATGSGMHKSADIGAFEHNSDGHDAAGNEGISKSIHEISSDGIGAGLILFETEDIQNAEGYRSKFMASDDGTTLATGGGNMHPSAPVTSTGQHDRWSSPQTRESGLTVVHSSESMQNSRQNTSTQSASADVLNGSLPAPPPRGDSLAGMNSMAMSTPILGATDSIRAQQARSLDSVTARLYDPSQSQPQPHPPVRPLALRGAGSPDMVSEDSPLTGTFSGWQSNSGIALNSIQYQYTTTGSTYTAGQSKVSPRPRRSISLVTATGLRNFAQELHAEDIPEHETSGTVAELDADAKNIIDRSGMAVRARRIAGDRRVGQANTQPSTSVNDERPARRPLPQVPVKFESNRTDTSVSAPLAAGHGRRTFSAQSSSERVSVLLGKEKDSNIYSLYPQPHGPKPVTAYSSEAPPSQRHSPAVRGPRQFPGSSGSVKQDVEQYTQQQQQQSQDRDQRGPANDYDPAIQQPQAQIPTRAQHGTPEISSRPVMSWLSDEDPANEYEVIGGKPNNASGSYICTSELEQGAAAAEAAVRAAAAMRPRPSRPAARSGGNQQQLGLSESSQQKLRPIVNADPKQIEQMAVMLQERFTSAASNGQIGVPMEQYKQGKAPKSSDSKDNKTGISRLKTIFRIGHGNSSTPNSTPSNINNISLPKPTAASMANVGKGAGRKAAQVRGVHSSLPYVSVQQRVSDQRELSGSTDNAPRQDFEPHHIPRPPRQPNTAEYDQKSAFSNSPRVSVRGTASETGSPLGQVGRLQVAVPPGHLSFVYPDSPMSKTDTLGRSSVDSLAKKLSASGIRSSGRAYLVDPDMEDENDDEDNDDEGVMGDRDYVSPSSHKIASASLRQPNAPYGSHLHATPSNSTTLHSFSNMQQLQQQLQQKQYYKRRSGLFDGQGGNVGNNVSARFYENSGQIGVTAQQQQQQHQQQRLVTESAQHGSWVPESLSLREQRSTDDSGYSQMRSVQTERHGSESNVADQGYGSSSTSVGVSAAYSRHHPKHQDQRGYVAMHRGGTQSSSGGGDAGGTYVLPSIISNKSPLLDGYEFDPRSSGYYQHSYSSVHDQQQQLVYDKIQQRGSSRRSTIIDDHDQDDELVATDMSGGVSSGNSPRRSRSLRNTITSLRRRLSRSSRNGAANSSPDVTPSGMDETVAAASVH